MSFGFGIGDIVTCSQMAWKTIDALRTAGSEFEGLRLELSSLTSVISGLEAEARGPMPLINSASPERQQEMRSLLRNCTTSMRDLQDLVAKYKGMNSNTKRDFVAWMKFAAKDKRSPREKLAVHTASINIFLTTLSHGSLARLEFLIKNGQRREISDSGPGDVRGLGQAGRINAKPEVGAVWQQIGSSLADEGIGQQDVERFQEEVKAYVRYLVRGETPFWAASRQTVASERDAEKRMRQEVQRKSSAQLDDEAEGHLPQDRARASRAKSEATRRTKLEESRRLDQSRRERLRDEVMVAHELQDIASGVRVEEVGRRRAKESTAVDFEEVVALADQFDNLFEYQSTPNRVQYFRPELDVERQKPPTAKEDKQDPEHIKQGVTRNLQRDIEEQLLRDKAEASRRRRVHEIRGKLEKLRDKHNQYLDDKRWGEVQDLEDHAIPLQIELLEREGVKILSGKAWQLGYTCDVCQFWIPGPRYHCGTCQGSSGASPQEGNWDICEECWNVGTRCTGGDAHKLVKLHD